MFDLKQDGVIEFEEFVRSLSIFHPNAPEAEKLACKTAVTEVFFTSLACYDMLPPLIVFFCRSIFIQTALPVTSLLTWGRIFLIAVVFRLCDLKCTGYIERDEVIVLKTLQQFFDNASCGNLIGDKNLFMCCVPHNGNLSHIQACTHLHTHKYI